MSRRNRTTLSAVEKLIEQRRLYHDWLEKLDAGVDGMPPHVVERVRNDYRSRLEGVLGELGEHHDSLQQALRESEQRLHEVETQERAKRDELAELKLRKLVGEMNEEQFAAASGELNAALESLGKENGAATRDIERYEEILDVIVAPTPVPEPVAEVPPPPAPEPVAEAEVVIPYAVTPAPAARVSGARPAVKDAQPDGKRSKVDELDFLRSVTGGAEAARAGKGPGGRQAAAPAPRRREEVAAARPEVEPEAPEVPEPPAAVQPEPEPQAPVTINAAPHMVELPDAVAEPAGRKSAGTGTAKAQVKSIVCGECSAPNLPTEWYCEKCGAELSAF